MSAGSARRALVGPAAGSVLVLLLFLGLISMLFGQQIPLELTESSHGVVPGAWGAAFDLLTELELAHGRSRRRMARRPKGSTQWVVKPAWANADLDDRTAQIEAHARAGGTVVLFGASDRALTRLGLVPEPAPVDCDPGQDGAEPLAAVDGGVTTRGDDSPTDEAPDDDGFILHELEALEPEPVSFGGAPLPQHRSIAVDPEHLLSPAGEEVEVAVGGPEAALVLRRVLGAGQIVAVADARFLDNAHLDAHDHALLLVDLARAYGAPTFDEHCHGLIEVRSMSDALGTPWLTLAACCWGLLTLASLLFARRWPTLRAEDTGPPPPTLTRFVRSLSDLYREHGGREADAVFDAYRDGFLRRLRGAHPMSDRRFEAWLEQTAAAAGPLDGPALRGEVRPQSGHALLQAARALERQAARIDPRRQ